MDIDVLAIAAVAITVSSVCTAVLSGKKKAFTSQSSMYF